MQTKFSQVFLEIGTLSQSPQHRRIVLAVQVTPTTPLICTRSELKHLVGMCIRSRHIFNMSSLPVLIRVRSHKNRKLFLC